MLSHFVYFFPYYYLTALTMRLLMYRGVDIPFQVNPWLLAPTNVKHQ